MTTNAISTENLKQKLSSILHSGGGEKSTKIAPLSLINENPYETTLQHNLVVTTNLNENTTIFKVKLALTPADYATTAVCYTENETVCDIVSITPGIYGEKYSQPSNINIAGFGYLDATTTTLAFLVVDEASGIYINSYTKFAIYDKNNTDNFIKFDFNNSDFDGSYYRYLLKNEGIGNINFGLNSLYLNNAFNSYYDFQDAYLDKVSEFVVSPVNSINSNLLLSQNYSGETIWIGSESFLNTQPTIEFPLDDLNLEKQHWYCINSVLSDDTLNVIVRFAPDSEYTKLAFKVPKQIYTAIEQLVNMTLGEFLNTFIVQYLQIYIRQNPNSVSDEDYIATCIDATIVEIDNETLWVYLTFNTALLNYTFICSNETIDFVQNNMGFIYIVLLFCDFHFE